MKKNMFGEQMDNIKLPKFNLQILKEKLKSIDFDKAFKVGVLLIGVMIIFKLNAIDKTTENLYRYGGFDDRDITNYLHDIWQRLR